MMFIWQQFAFGWAFHGPNITLFLGPILISAPKDGMILDIGGGPQLFSWIGVIRLKMKGKM